VLWVEGAEGQGTSPWGFRPQQAVAGNHTPRSHRAPLEEVASVSTMQPLCKVGGLLSLLWLRKWRLREVR
jgi:hypothetical protein